MDADSILAAHAVAPAQSTIHTPNGSHQSQELSAEDQKKVEELKKRDQEVRRHEQAHMAAAGSLARGGPSYTYETGPDGKQYAVAGSVDIESARVGGDPEATIAKAKKVQQAALAPADPSTQDRRVAAKAKRVEQEARQQLRQEQQEEQAQQARKLESEFYTASGTETSVLPGHGTINVFI